MTKKISRYLNIDNILAKVKVKILTYTKLIASFLICSPYTHGFSKKIGWSWIFCYCCFEVIKNICSDFIHKELSVSETGPEQKVIQVQHTAFGKITFTLGVFWYLSSDIDQIFSLAVNTSLKLKPPIYFLMLSKVIII